MEHLPIELIGNILSWLNAARDVVIASTTCKKWHQAFRSHLHSISFDSQDWPAYREFTTSELEILISRTMCQTSCLHSLSILMDLEHNFSATLALTWLLHTQETLRKLHFKAIPSFDILEKCGKLEELLITDSSIAGVEQSYQNFPCLKLLVLSYVNISASDLRLLLTACPKIDTLKLICPWITESGVEAIMELTSPSLKCICIESCNLDTFVLKADSLEQINFRYSTFAHFKLSGKSSLRILILDHVDLPHLAVKDISSNLEVLDVSDSDLPGPDLSDMIAKSSKLRKFRLWGVVIYEGGFLNLNTLPACMPCLSHLSLNYYLEDDTRMGEVYSRGFRDCDRFEDVVVLELGWYELSDRFTERVELLLGKCPNLRKLVIQGAVSEAKSWVLAKFTSSMVRLMREYMMVEVRFEYQ